MSAPNSEVDICNLALDLLSHTPISSIDPPSTEDEEVMARWYDITRRMCLREYVWNFCQEYAELARSGAGDDGYADAYLLPSNCIRLNSIGTYPDDPISDYTLQSGRIVWVDNNGGVLPIRYNADVTVVSEFDPLFIQILAMRLALNVAFKFTTKKSVTDFINGLLAQAEPKAISVDGQERVPRRIQKSKYLDARRSRGYRGTDPRYYGI